MILELDELSHNYGDERAVDDVSFGVDSGELVALLGPSGCGKTTIVQAIAGHVRPTAGRVMLRGSDVTGEPPETREVGLVFQRSALYPHMTVAENIAYGLAARNIAPDQRDERVAEYLELVDLVDQREAYPAELSGGQKRRVELARALAPEPDVLLLDEPLSALDRALRDRLCDEIARIQRKTGVTTLYVTHDQDEAMALADRLVVMNDGSVSGRGDPRTLYESPPTAFVASFLGQSNTFAATITDTHPLALSFAGGEVALDGSAGGQAGQRVISHVRPANLSLQPFAESATSIDGVVSQVTDMGRRYETTVEIESGDELVVEQSHAPPSVGTEVTVWLSADDIAVFDSETGDRLDTELSQVPGPNGGSTSVGAPESS